MTAVRGTQTATEAARQAAQALLGRRTKHGSGRRKPLARQVTSLVSVSGIILLGERRQNLERKEGNL